MNSTLSIRTNKLLLILILGVIFVHQNAHAQYYGAYNDSIQKNFEFINAASNGDVALVNSQIRKGVNINHKDADGGTALFYAVSAENAEMVKILLYHGADPNLGLHNGFTPLMNAACFSFEMAELLLLKPQIKLDVTDINKYTAMHYAAYYGQFDIIDMLFFYGADASIKSLANESVFFMATYSGDSILLNQLLQKGNNPFESNTMGLSPLNIIIENNDSLLFDYLLSKKGSMSFVKEDLNSLVYSAIKYGNSYALNKLSEVKGQKDKAVNTKNLYRTAYIYKSKDAIDYLSSNNYKKPYLPIPYSVFAGIVHTFNNDDYTSYFGLGVNDVRYNMSLSVHYGTRFKPKAFLEEISDNVYYQNWEVRNIFAIQLRKDFVLIETDELEMGPYISADIQWHWASYHGRSKSISGKTYIVPEIGFSISNSFLSLDIAYQYANYNLYNTSNYKFKIGIKGKLSFYTKPNKYYPYGFN